MGIMRVKDLRDPKKRRHWDPGVILGRYVFGGIPHFFVSFGVEEEVLTREEFCELSDSLVEGLSSGPYDLGYYILRLRASLLYNDDRLSDSLSRLAIKDVGYQRDMAHLATTTDAKGFLIADDVGLGKTVEAGLVMHRLIKQGRAESILLLCPAGLVRKWREELSEKMGLDGFRVYCSDFNIPSDRPDPDIWHRYDRVISSIDRLKIPETHREWLELSNKGWDLVIVDEAHHLSATDKESTYNYRLLKLLRPRSRFFLFLTATPHGGNDEKFVKLLGLLDEDIRRTMDIRWDDVRHGEVNRARINRIVGRNRKYQLKDENGRPLFIPRRFPDTDVWVDKASYSDFMRGMEAYVSKGFEKVGGGGNRTYDAVEFVLTGYLKMASSSPGAVRRSLARRKENLLSGQLVDAKRMGGDLEDRDSRFEGESEETAASRVKLDIADEVETIDRIIESIDQICLEEDGKLMALRRILYDVEHFDRDPTKKVLVFTEYLGTKERLEMFFQNEDDFRDGWVVIQGGLDQRERDRRMRQFDEEKRVLISTEAGSEGVDLHRRCHVMINFDMPWSPTRLKQRIGRLERFGQEKEVHVYNILLEDSIDMRVMEIQKERQESIAKCIETMEGGGVQMDKTMIGLESRDLSESIPTSVRQVDIARAYLSSKRDGVPVITDEIKEGIQNDVRLGEENFRFNRVIENPPRVEWERPEFSLADLKSLIEDYLILQSREGEVAEDTVFKEDGGVVAFSLPKEISEMYKMNGRRLSIGRPVEGSFDKDVVIEKEHRIKLLGSGEENIDAILAKLMKDGERGVFMSSRIHVGDGHSMKGKRGLFASYLVYEGGSHGMKELKGVEFSFIDEGQRVMNGSRDRKEMKALLDSVVSGAHEVLEGPPMGEGDLSRLIERQYMDSTSIPRKGQKGMLLLSSLAWLEFV